MMLTLYIPSLCFPRLKCYNRKRKLDFKRGKRSFFGKHVNEQEVKLFSLDRVSTSSYTSDMAPSNLCSRKNPRTVVIVLSVTAAIGYFAGLTAFIVEINSDSYCNLNATGPVLNANDTVAESVSLDECDNTHFGNFYFSTIDSDKVCGILTPTILMSCKTCL